MKTAEAFAKAATTHEWAPTTQIGVLLQFISKTNPEAFLEFLERASAWEDTLESLGFSHAPAGATPGDVNLYRVAWGMLVFSVNGRTPEVATVRAAEELKTLTGGVSVTLTPALSSAVLYPVGPYAPDTAQVLFRLTEDGDPAD